MATKIRSSRDLYIDANLDYNSKKAIKLADGTALTDGINKGQLDEAIRVLRPIKRADLDVITAGQSVTARILAAALSGVQLSSTGADTGTGDVSLSLDWTMLDARWVSVNDYRLTNARNAADVYAWAKASVKPSYTYSEVGAAPASTVSFPGFGTSHILAAYGDHDHAGVYLTGITSLQVTNALGFTPYSASNPSGFITAAALSGYATQSWVNGLGLAPGSGSGNYIWNQNASAQSASMSISGDIFLSYPTCGSISISSAYSGNGGGISFLNGASITTLQFFGSSGNIISAGTIRGSILQSTVGTGSAPFIVESTTIVPNLNSQLWNGHTNTFPGSVQNTSPDAIAGISGTNVAPFSSAGIRTFLGLSSAVTGSGLTNYIPKWVDGANRTLGNSPFYTDVDNNFYLPKKEGLTNYIIVDSGAYTGKIALQAGYGSTSAGGAINLYGAGHATKAGDIAIGISAQAGAKFRINTGGLDGGEDLVTVLRSGQFGINCTPVYKFDVYSTTANDRGVNSIVAGTSGTIYGGVFQAVGTGGVCNIGGYFRGSGGDNGNIGVKINSIGAGSNNYSIYSDADAQSYFKGSLGIGTVPTTKFHLAGYDASNWISTWDNTGTSGHKMYFGYNNSGGGTTYGLYISGGNGSQLDLAVANKFYVYGTGVVNINNLSGTGTRMVVADSAGTLSTQTIPSGGGGGTVVSVGVTSANGFAGTSSGGVNPALTLSTTITGILQGNGTAISAVSGTGFLKLSGTTISFDNSTYVTGTPWTGLGYITSSALSGYATQSWVASQGYLTGTPWTSYGYLTGITSAQVTGALGFTPYSNANPSGYITSGALSGYATQTWVYAVVNGYLPLSGGTLTGALYGTTITTTGIIQGSEVKRGSSRELKTNIKYFDFNAIDYLNEICVNSYNLKADGSFGIGFIAEDTHWWLSGRDQKSHLFGNHLGILTKAIQDEDKKVEELKKQIVQLQSQVAQLEKNQANARN